MAFSDKQKSLPPPPVPYAYRLPFHNHHHHRGCIEISPHCPLHSSYLLPPNSHDDHHRAPATTHDHHFLKLSPGCPLHGYLLPHCPLHSLNFHSNNQSMTSFPIIPNFASNPNVDKLNSIPPEADTNCKSNSLMMHDRNEEVEVEEEDDDEEEVIYVLTDEWKEFFAKSEAKRRLAKKQAKKKGKD